MKDELERQVAETCNRLFRAGGVSDVVELTRPEERFGDFSTNAALQLAAKLSRKPRDVAEELAAELRKALAGRISEVSIAGPGFINLKLADKTLLGGLKAVPRKSLDEKVAVAEYSDPNPFKALHAGHLYTSVVGDAIANLLETAGATVHRVNFGGDVGLHVGKSMWGIIKELGGEHPAKLRTVPNDLEIKAGWLAKRYVEGSEAYENDPVAKEEIAELNKRVYELHSRGDRRSDFAQIYWTCREWSYDYFDHFYETIGVKPFRYYPESETIGAGIKKTKELLEQGILKKSDGAVIFPGEQHDLHTRVFLTKDNLPTYETKDLGLIFKKYEDYRFDLSLVVTGNDIIEYMKVVLKVVEQVAPELAAATTHLTHGLVRLAGGEKMSSRKGNVLAAADIIESATRAARQARVIESKEREKDTVYGAIKYAFLKNRIGGDIVYDPTESVSLEGNSGPYLQYAHARARSILSKAEAAASIDESTALETDERSLVRKIGEYAETVDKAVRELMPHHLCTYLYELAQTFNRFYEHSRVIGDPRQAIRLTLVREYAETLQSGLKLLGIAAPDKM